MHHLSCLVPIRLFSNRKLSFVCSSPIHVMNFCAFFCLYSPCFRFSCSNTLPSSLLPLFHFLLSLLLSSMEESDQPAVYPHSDSPNGHVCKTVEFLFHYLSIPSLFFLVYSCVLVSLSRIQFQVVWYFSSEFQVCRFCFAV